MRPLPLTLCLLAASTGLDAQGSVGGFAVDKTTGSRLACIEVSLRRADGEVVAETRTTTGGAFLFAAPDTGLYRLTFDGAGVHPVTTDADSLFPDQDSHRVYQLDLALAIAGRDFAGYPDSLPDAPPRPRDPHAAPRYPERLVKERLEGTAVVRFLVDSIGKVDARSVERLMESDVELFNAVKAWLMRAEFLPARRAFVPVCALVVQTFEFRMQR